jgi:hypothetical protein
MASSVSVANKNKADIRDGNEYKIPKCSWKKIQKGYIKFNYVVCLSDTCCSCHVTIMGSLIVFVNKRAD